MCRWIDIYSNKSLFAYLYIWGLYLYIYNQALRLKTSIHEYSYFDYIVSLYIEKGKFNEKVAFSQQ